MMLSDPKVSMLRLQPTPKCNLNCTYCYIPESVRRRSGTMSLEVLETTLGRLLDEELLDDRLRISWHGAEPLYAGLDWYEVAFDSVTSILGDRVKVSHIFQTNGVLLSDEWCRFVQRHPVSIGVSMDGTAKQNASRVTWSGRPAHELALRGTDLLNRHGIPWTLLSVVTHATMRAPRDFIEFVRSTGCRRLGFKVEESNVAHSSDLERREDVDQLYAEFVRALWEAFPIDGPVRVREFEEYMQTRSAPGRTIPVTLIPLRNLTVAANGDYTIFSGELLFREDDRFVFGNVLDGPLLGCLTTNRFREIATDMLSGVKRCASACPHYQDCGSFYISQKHAETGSFDADETLACRLEIKTLYRVLDELRSQGAPKTTDRAGEMERVVAVG
jgi:uncharacterized protein